MVFPQKERNRGKSANRIQTSDIINDVKQVGEKLGHAPLRKDYIEHGKYSSQTAVNRFDSWIDVLDESGFDGEAVYKGNSGSRYSNEDITDELKRIGEIVGGCPDTGDFREYSDFTYTVATERFDGWTKALRAAGFAIPRGQKTTNCGVRIPDEVLIEDLLAGAAYLGKAPSYEDYRRCGKHSPLTILERFGGWSEAKEAAGLDGDLTESECQKLYFEHTIDGV